jgi:hypothetical protein
MCEHLLCRTIACMQNTLKSISLLGHLCGHCVAHGATLLQPQTAPPILVQPAIFVNTSGVTSAGCCYFC